MCEKSKLVLVKHFQVVMARAGDWVEEPTLTLALSIVHHKQIIK